MEKPGPIFDLYKFMTGSRMGKRESESESERERERVIPNQRSDDPYRLSLQRLT